MLHWTVMSYGHILFEVDGAGVALVTVNRPDKRNALSSAVLAELEDAFDHIGREASIRAAIVTGAGDKAFVAGADIAEIAKFSPLEAREHSAFGQAVFRKIETVGKPTVAAVNGYALGGGLELAMACAVRFAAENAVLGQPEVKLGLIPGYGGTQRLPQLVGRGRALDLLLSGEPIGAQEAFRIGLVNAVVATGQAVEYSKEWLAKALSNSQVALRLALDSVNAGLNAGPDEGMRFESAAFGLCAGTADCREGTRAFLEKRRPEFSGK